MPKKDPDSITQHEPTTFQERGVAVPFTTPQLLGTRARLGYKQVLELVTPNPAGGPGVYVTAWNGLAALCRPTLHDRALVEQLAGLSVITPSTIRSVARSVAAAGLAGELPQEAAVSAAGSDEAARLVTSVQLWHALIQAADGGPAAAIDARPTEAGTRSRAALTRVSASVGKSADWVERALDHLAEALVPIGAADDATPARMPRLLDMLQQLRAEVADWSARRMGEDAKECADMITSAADFTLTTARNALDEARELAKDVMNLVQRYAADAGAVTQLVTRTEWLLDGWEQLFLIWNYSRDDASRRAALVEIADLIPIVPAEALGWSKIGAAPVAPLRARGMIQMNQDWRTGAAVFGLIARNESFRGIST